MVRARVARRLALLGCLAAGCLMAIAFTTHAYTDGGVSENGKDGCGTSGTCHTDTQGDSRVVVLLEGRPEKFEGGKTYEFLLKAAPRPDLIRPGTEIKAGFAIDSSDGFFTSKDEKLAKLAAETLTHTRDGTKVLEWGLKWTAPNDASKPVTIWGNVMFNGGMLGSTTEDKWNVESFLLWGAGKSSPGPEALVFLVLPLAAWAWRRKA